MKAYKFEKVLIALDIDPTAQKVAETGYVFAKTLGAQAVLLHVISNPMDYAIPGHITIMGFVGHIDLDPIKPNNFDHLKKTTQHFLDKSKHHLGDESLQTIVAEGECAETILKTAADIKADVIVMGSHSRKWLENIIMGSETEKVLHKSSLPLLIIPTKQKK